MFRIISIVSIATILQNVALCWINWPEKKKHKIDKAAIFCLFCGHVLPQQHWQLSNKLKQVPPPSS